MSDPHEDDETEDRSGRPPRAVVGSHRPDEEMFGKAFDGRIIRRIWSFVQPLSPADAASRSPRCWCSR